MKSPSKELQIKIFGFYTEVLPPEDSRKALIYQIVDKEKIDLSHTKAIKILAEFGKSNNVNAPKELDSPKDFISRLLYNENYF